MDQRRRSVKTPQNQTHSQYNLTSSASTATLMTKISNERELSQMSPYEPLRQRDLARCLQISLKNKKTHTQSQQDLFDQLKSVDKSLGYSSLLHTEQVYGDDNRSMASKQSHAVASKLGQ